MSFRNRAEAGRRLADALQAYKGQNIVVLALPRGGVPVAAEISEALAAPLDLVLVRKIGAPFDKELAVGAVAEAGEAVTVRNDDLIADLGISETLFKRLRDAELGEIAPRREAYLKGRPRAPIAGQVAIVVDDGVATGATTLAALRAARAAKPEKLVLAVPVAPSSTLARLRSEADEVICLEPHVFMGAIGYYYADFRQVSDGEVQTILARFAPKAAAR